MKEKLREFFHDILETHKSRTGKIFGGFLVVLITLSIGIFICENLVIFRPWRIELAIADKIILGLFALEYFIRLLISRNKFKFALSFLGIIDFLVILPLFAHISQGLVFLRGFRVFRILQLLKTIRYSNLMLMFFRSFRHYRDEIQIFVITFFLVVIVGSLAMFSIEGGVNPNFSTVPDAMWWTVVTITTVGYGDVVPITIAGKILAAIIMFMGLAAIAIMTAVLTKVFIDHFFGKRLHHCERCHFPHHDHDAKFCKNCGNQLDTEKLAEAEFSHPHSVHKVYEK
jgi:voltage-gated potassium channel